jgi:hypothetical protein
MKVTQIILAAAAALALAGCPAAHGSYPTRACMTDSDCYVGERCESGTTCVAASTPDDQSASDSPQDQGPTTGDDQ